MSMTITSDDATAAQLQGQITTNQMIEELKEVMLRAGIGGFEVSEIGFRIKAIASAAKAERDKETRMEYVKWLESHLKQAIIAGEPVYAQEMRIELESVKSLLLPNNKKDEM